MRPSLRHQICAQDPEVLYNLTVTGMLDTPSLPKPQCVISFSLSLEAEGPVGDTRWHLGPHFIPALQADVRYCL